MPHHPIKILLPLSDNPRPRLFRFRLHVRAIGTYQAVRWADGVSRVVPAEGLWAHVRLGEFTPKAGNLNHLTGWRLPMCMRE